ncbi:hypothetical protein OUZ56_032677 [Daphnia magna]|uniref:Uncharacterized protein n=1 Tax=Daphnia magna TaxID=35525 RepID=A0ABQ9ZXI9_9CRUS|nr:hypothetical protein OUZ56_032677 [Daphnia magna]
MGFGNQITFRHFQLLLYLWLAIDLVKQKFKELFGGVPAPTIFVAYYELALLGVVADCFPGCKSSGCWFHSPQVSLVQHQTG